MQFLDQFGSKQNKSIPDSEIHHHAATRIKAAKVLYCMSCVISFSLVEIAMLLGLYLISFEVVEISMIVDSIFPT